VEQGGSIPVFLKRSHNDWECQGYHRLTGHSESRRELRDLERLSGRTGVTMALFFEPSPYQGNAYLLTWNPEQWEWADLESMAEQTAEGRPVEGQWSCGNTKRIRPGDRLFLLRQGVEPRGIIAAGWATSGSYESPHWDAARRERGDTALRVNIRFDRILNP